MQSFMGGNKPSTDKVKSRKRVNKQVKYFRCNFHSFIKLESEVHDDITPEHIQMLKGTPFGNLFMCFYERKILIKEIVKSTDDIVSIMSTYSQDKDAFELGNKWVKLTVDDVALTFGMPRRGKKVNPLPKMAKEGMESDLVQRYFPEVKTLFKKDIVYAIKKAVLLKGKSDQEDFSRLVILYMATTIFFTNKQGCIVWSFIQHIENFEKMNKISWPTVVHEHLMTHIRKYHESPVSHVSGCVILLLYWFCEHVDIMPPLQGLECECPRIVRWSLSDLSKKMAAQPLRELPDKKVSFELRNLSACERMLLDVEGEKELKVENEDELHETDWEKLRRLEIKNTALRKRISYLEKKVQRFQRFQDDNTSIDDDEEEEENMTKEEKEIYTRQDAQGKQDKEEMEAKHYIEKEMEMQQEKLGEVGKVQEELYECKNMVGEEMEARHYNEKEMEMQQEKLGEVGKVQDELYECKKMGGEEMETSHCNEKEMGMQQEKLGEVGKVQEELYVCKNMVGEEMEARHYNEKEMEMQQEKLGEVGKVQDELYDCKKMGGEEMEASHYNEKEMGMQQEKLGNVQDELYECKKMGGEESIEKLAIVPFLFKGEQISYQESSFHTKKQTKKRMNCQVMEYEYKSQKKINKRRKNNHNEVEREVVQQESMRVHNYPYPERDPVSIRLRHLKSSKLLHYLDDKQKHVVQIFFLNATKSTVAWKDEEKGICVVGSAIEGLIFGGFIDYQIIDWYAFNLLRKLPNHARKSEFFSALAWTCVRDRLRNSEKHSFVDVLENLNENVEFLFFPMNTAKSSKSREGYHWTLLHFNCKSMEWRHYNSMLPRGNGRVNKYVVDAQKLQTRVIEVLNAADARNNGKQYPADTELTCMVCPQQGESVDCALFVCKFMKKVACGEDLTKNYSKEEMEKKRAKWAYKILADQDRSWKMKLDEQGNI